MLGPNLRKMLINWNWSLRERRKKKDQIKNLKTTFSKEWSKENKAI